MIQHPNDPTAVPPQVISLVVCAQIHRDESGMFTLRDVLLKMWMPGFPCRLGNLGIHAELAGGMGFWQPVLRLRHPDIRLPIWSWPFAYSATDPLEVQAPTVNTKALTFPRPGVYLAEVTIKDTILAARPLIVEAAPPRGRDDA